MPSVPAHAYCGPPPRPAELFGSWNLDPLLLVALGVGALAWWLAARRGVGLLLRSQDVRWARERGDPTRRWFASGWLALALTFVSPLCALGVALFSARVAQHLLLVALVAPLLALARPERLLRLAPPAPPSARTVTVAGLTYALVFWAWHAPAAYDATFGRVAIYWTMHLSLLASATWVWSVMVRAGAGPRLALGLGSALQMGLLGALLVLAPRPLYRAHLETTAAWGLTPVGDQALGGLLCWILGCLPFALYGLAGLRPWLHGATVQPPTTGSAPGAASP